MKKKDCIFSGLICMYNKSCTIPNYNPGRIWEKSGKIGERFGQDSTIIEPIDASPQVQLRLVCIVAEQRVCFYTCNFNVWLSFFNKIYSTLSHLFFFCAFNYED